MAGQDAEQDRNDFPALLGHSGTSGTAETRRVIVTSEGAISVDTSEANYALSVDGTTTTDVTYVGIAPIASAGTTAVWQIKKIDETTADMVDITWADGNDNFDNLWSGRGTVSYS